MGAAGAPSAAAALMVLLDADRVRGLGVLNENDEAGFHGISGSLLVFGVAIVGVNRPA